MQHNLIGSASINSYWAIVAQARVQQEKVRRDSETSNRRSKREKTLVIPEKYSTNRGL